ncbi:MAG: V-type ATPase subunit [Thermoplasmata archaeon]
MDSTYSGAYGRVKVYQTEFLSSDFINHLIELNSLEDIMHALSSTPYQEDITSLISLYKNPDLLEMVLNRHLIKKNKIAMFAMPPLSKDLLKVYFSKWDIENIKSILSSKLLGYNLKENESFLVSFRDIPMGIFGGTISYEDYKILMSQDSIEDIANYLSKFGYGSLLIQYIDTYRKTGDISNMLSSLDTYFYTKLMESLKYYRGDEGPLIRYFREDIDSKNLMMILKSKDLGVKYADIASNVIPYGNLLISYMEELYKSENVEEICNKLESKIIFDKALKTYQETGQLSGFEIELKAGIYKRYLEILSSQSLSIGSIFAFILRSEIERQNLRAIVVGKNYLLEKEKIAELIIKG